MEKIIEFTVTESYLYFEAGSIVTATCTHKGLIKGHQYTVKSCLEPMYYGAGCWIVLEEIPDQNFESNNFE
jgi:hypothetical protein